MSIVLFAIIGSLLKAGAGYWIIFALYCVWWLIANTASIISWMSDR